MKRRIMSFGALVVAAAMIMIAIPANTYGASEPDKYIFDLSEGNIEINSGTKDKTIKITCGDTTLDNVSPTEHITIIQSGEEAVSNYISIMDYVHSSALYLTLSELNIESSSDAVKIEHGVDVYVELDGTNKLKSKQNTFYHYSGNGRSLII